MRVGTDAAIATAYRIVADTPDRARTASALTGYLESVGRRPVLIDDAVLADLNVSPEDERTLGALVRLLETTGATPVLALAQRSDVGTPFHPGQELSAELDWVI